MKKVSTQMEETFANDKKKHTQNREIIHKN